MKETYLSFGNDLSAPIMQYKVRSYIPETEKGLGKLHVVHMHEDELDAFVAGRTISANFKVPFHSLRHSESSIKVLVDNPDLKEKLSISDTDANVCGPYIRYVCFEMKGGGSATFDPNRIYSDDGIRSTTLLSGADAKEQLVYSAVGDFANELLKAFHFDQAEWVVALHNNLGKSYGLESYLLGGSEHDVALEVNLVESGLPSHNFLITNDRGLYDYVKDKGVGAVLISDQISGDGSLSDLAAISGMKYVNIETLRTDAVAAHANDSEWSALTLENYGSLPQELIFGVAFDYISQYL